MKTTIMKTTIALGAVVAVAMIASGCSATASKVPMEPAVVQMFEQKKAEMKSMEEKADAAHLEVQRVFLASAQAERAEETVELQVEGPLYTPPHKGGDGDRDFHGHGPEVDSSARLSIKNQNQLWLEVYMKAEETKRDYTTAEGSHPFCIFNDPYAYATITSILSDNYSEHSYIDENHEDDNFAQPPGELVREFEYVGDTKGDEAGSRTHVKLHLNPIKITVRKNKPDKIITIEYGPTPKYVPPRAGKGDRDFHGHGPNVTVSAKIEVKNQKEIWATVQMWAKETKKDYTEVYGHTYYTIYRGDKPIEILSDTFSGASYTDSNHEDDELFLGGAELVNKFIVVGDTKGDEAGRQTGVMVYFNPIVIKEVPQ